MAPGVVRLTILMIGLAALIAGCGPASSSPGGQAPPQDRVSTGQQPAAGQCEPGKEQWRTASAPKRGGVMVRAMPDFEHLDPSKPGRQGITHVGQVYNTLLELRGCFFEDTTMVAGLAKSWEISPDGRTWTLTLRDDVKWHNKPPVNGRPFTSKDVAWTIDYNRKEGLYRAYWEGVAEHREPDDRTVVLQLKEADADFAAKIGYYQNMILPHEVKEVHGDFKTVAVGTGAFVLQDYKMNQEVTIERNPDYAEQGADGQRLPYLDGVKNVYFADYAAEVAAMRTGQLDSTKFDGFRKLDADQLKQTNPSLRSFEQLQFTHAGLWFDLRKKPWDEPRVRKAAALAIDREEVIASNRGGAAPSSFIPAFLKDYTWTADKMAEKYKPDPARAKQLLQEAGFDSSREFLMKTSSIYQQDAELVQQQLAKVGIKTRLEVEGGIFTAVLQKGEFDIAWGIVGGQVFLSFWASDFVRTGSSTNYIHLSDPQVDQLAAAQAKELDEGKRKQVIDQLHDRLYDLMPYVPAVSRIYYGFFSCRSKNMRQVTPSYNPRTVVEGWLDPAGCS